MNSGPAQTATDFCALISGSLVNSLLEMMEDAAEVNTALEKIGYRVARRLAHDFARRSERVETADAVIGVIVLQWSGAIGNSRVKPETIENEKSYRLKFEKSVYTKQVHHCQCCSAGGRAFARSRTPRQGSRFSSSNRF
jgi:hypothetical protein